MDAMILAAGLGTRLGALTQTIPKALVDIGGRTALEHVARRLTAAGADRLIINVHHHAHLIIEHVDARGGFGAEVIISHEQDAPLETGGGLRHAARHFRRDAPFFLHNVDVLCDADLHSMYAAHMASGALVTLAVNRRETARTLLFDANGLLRGRHDSRRDAPPAEPRARQVAFAGIHVIEPRLLDMITETGAFSIMDVYMRLSAEGERIAAHDVSAATWLEIGTPERLERARRAFGSDAPE